MKRRQVVSELVAIILTCSLAGNVGAQQSAGKAIPAGTQVVVAFTQEVRPGHVSIGDRVPMTVVNDVEIGGRVLIRKGAAVHAEVTRAKKKGAVGSGAELAIQLSTVEAADGTQVPIQATKVAEGDNKVVMTVILGIICLPLFLLNGGDTVVPAGSTVSATVMGNVDIK